jgi:formylglycine-generating enzyme required for sulfatase activity
MSDADPLSIELKELVRQQKVVALIGSGVSLNSTDLALSWDQLIESAIEWCETVGVDKPWCDGVRQQLRVSFPDFRLSAAQLAHRKLEETGELGVWLRSVFENWVLKDTSVILALAQLNVPLVTTNYDDLIERVVVGLQSITWKDRHGLTRFLRGEGPSVLHLHGYWKDPQSVVLGIRSYTELTISEHAQQCLKALGLTKSFLLVGCGDAGLSDPNLGSFFDWLAAFEKAAAVEHRHYRLVRRGEYVAPRGRLFPLVYGDAFTDLPRFLAGLAPTPTAAYVRRSLPVPIDSYLRSLEHETARLKLLGLGRGLQIEMAIEEAFVPLRTMLAGSFEQRPADGLHDGRTPGEQSLELAEVFRTAARLGQRGIILLGEPGSGKTTGARQIAWRLASGHSRPEELALPADTVPVLLSLRNLRREMLAGPTGLRTFLIDETRSATAGTQVQSPGLDLWNRQTGALLWILDGLDEVVDPAARKLVAGSVRDTLDTRPNDWFLVTSRFQGYFLEGASLGPRFVEFHVEPLDNKQIDQFVRSWFRVAYGELLRAHPEEVADKAKVVSDQLLNILQLPSSQLGHIRELCANPLLLTILCIFFHEEQKLPTNRAELYAQCVRVLLEFWRRAPFRPEVGAESNSFDGETARAVLARLAWWLHQEVNRTGAPLEEFATEATRGLSQVAPSSGLGHDGSAFVERMRDVIGILAMGGEGDGRCGFLHLTFQEYLAAEYAAREGLASELATRAADSWWREVALLSLRRSRSFCEAFFREMLAIGTAERYPDLAERYLSEASYFASQPFVDELRQERSPQRIAAVLRLLRDRSDQVPELHELCIHLARSPDAEVRGFSSEILARSGYPLPAVASKPLDVQVDECTGITFVLIPVGEFIMGSESGHRNERPVRLVRIDKPFLLSKYPVTNAQFARYLDETGNKAKMPAFWDHRRFNQPEQPVVGISWWEAIAYCEWANGRLPTEEEWEFTCRAGSKTECCFGASDADLLREYAWFEENSDHQTQPVGAKKPNAWGLHDMYGNVWEWCDGMFGARGDRLCSLLPQRRYHRAVIRGGSWASPAEYCRSACRNEHDPTARTTFLGFRVVLQPPWDPPQDCPDPAIEVFHT